MTVTATPLVAAPDRTPVTPKLKAVMVTSEAPGRELDKAVDLSQLTGWSVDDVSGKDHAAVFAFDNPIGFDGGTLLKVELRFSDGHHGRADRERSGCGRRTAGRPRDRRGSRGGACGRPRSVRPRRREGRRVVAGAI
jgi:hypothetical protein